jgi:hypothetical protein
VGTPPDARPTVYDGGVPTAYQQSPRRRGLRPAVLVPAALILVLAVAGVGFFLGHKNASNNNPQAGGSSPAAGSRTSSNTSNTGSSTGSAPASSGTATPTAPASLAASGATSPTAVTGSSPTSAAGGVSGSTYSTPEPFALCDPNGAQWHSANLTPATSGGCGQNIAVAANSEGYSFNTTSKFPGGIPLSASNTETVSGVLPDSASGYHSRCLGAAEGAGATGYFGYLCNNGQWYVKNVIGLGENGVIVSKTVASGSFPFTAGTSYDVALKFASGTATLTISLTAGSNSPLVQTFSTGAFTPTVVGFGFETADGNIAINASDFYPTIGGYVYTAN